MKLIRELWVYPLYIGILWFCYATDRHLELFVGSIIATIMAGIFEVGCHFHIKQNTEINRIAREDARRLAGLESDE